MIEPESPRVGCQISRTGKYGTDLDGAAGSVNVTVTIIDDDTGAATATTTGVVIGAGIHTLNGVNVLEIVGTNDNDLVTINEQGNGLFKIHAGFFSEGSFRTFPTSSVDVIMVFFCGGDDRLNVAGNISTPILADGGSGNDFLKGGDGPDVLIGGTGADTVHGKKGDDALAGGSTQQDGDPAALLEALQAWTANVSYGIRVSGIDSELTVVDDETADELKGDQDRDLFYNGLGDNLNGKIDVSRDNAVSPLDALLVVNVLNGNSAASSEGEGGQASVAEPTDLSETQRREDADASSGFVGFVITTGLTWTTVRSESDAVSPVADDSDLATAADQYRGEPSTIAPSSRANARRVAAIDADELGSELAEDLVRLHEITPRELLFGRLVE